MYRKSLEEDFDDYDSEDEVLEDLNVFEGTHFPMKDELKDMVTLIEAIQDCYHFIHPMDINTNQGLNNFV